MPAKVIPVLILKILTTVNFFFLLFHVFLYPYAGKNNLQKSFNLNILRIE